MKNNLRFKPSLQVPNEQQIRKFHDATVQVLERTGAKITHPKARDIFSRGGARAWFSIS